MIMGLQQQLKDGGLEGSLVKLCRWFEEPRRKVVYTPTKAQAKLQEWFVTPIVGMIENIPSFPTNGSTKPLVCEPLLKFML